MAGLLVNESDRASHRRTYIENLRWAAQQLDKYGRVLLIEPINTRDIPGYFLNTQADAHSVREEVGEQNLLVQMDFYHVQIVEGDIAVKFRKYFAQVGHIQVASVPERNEPDDGEVNYRYLFTLIDDLNYPGWVGCEYRPRAGTVEGLGWMRSLLGDGRRGRESRHHWGAGFPGCLHWCKRRVRLGPVERANLRLTATATDERTTTSASLTMRSASYGRDGDISLTRGVTAAPNARTLSAGWRSAMRASRLSAMRAFRLSVMRAFQLSVMRAFRLSAMRYARQARGWVGRRFADRRRLPVVWGSS